MTYKRILVPFDGSKYAKKALKHAVELVRSDDAIIYLCTVVSIGNVIPPGSLLGLVKSASQGTLQKRLLSSAKIETERLQNAQIKYCKSKGVRAYPKTMIDGNIAQEILGIAKKKLVDLIVVGSQK
ncbi:MAG: universal stress protein [Candidatus Nitrosotenuis sp.]